MSQKATKRPTQDDLVEKEYNRIIAGGTPGDALAIALSFPDKVDVEALSKVFVDKIKELDANRFSESGRNEKKEFMKTLVAYASRVENADIKTLEKIVCEYGRAEDIIDFAKKVKNADMGNLEEAIVKNATGIGVGEFAKNVKGCDIAWLQSNIEDNTNHSLYFAKNVPGADLERLEKSVLKSDNEHNLYGWVSEVDDSHVMMFYERLMEIGKNNNSVSVKTVKSQFKKKFPEIDEEYADLNGFAYTIYMKNEDDEPFIIARMSKSRTALKMGLHEQYPDHAIVHTSKLGDPRKDLDVLETIANHGSDRDIRILMKAGLIDRDFMPSREEESSQENQTQRVD